MRNIFQLRDVYGGTRCIACLVDVVTQQKHMRYHLPIFLQVIRKIIGCPKAASFLKPRVQNARPVNVIRCWFMQISYGLLNAVTHYRNTQQAFLGPRHLGQWILYPKFSYLIHPSLPLCYLQSDILTIDSDSYYRSQAAMTRPNNALLLQNIN